MKPKQPNSDSLALSTAEVADHNHVGCPITLRPKGAARALGISLRKLWSLTDQGVIPHFKLGKVVLYPVESLHNWAVEQAETGLRQ